MSTRSPKNGVKKFLGRGYVTIKEAAEIKGCHPRTIEANIASGKIKAVRLGRGIPTHIHRRDLSAWDGPLPRGRRPDTKRRAPKRTARKKR